MLIAVAFVSATAAPLPIDGKLAQLGDAVSAAVVMLTGLAAAGNLTSVYLPRPVDAGSAWNRKVSKAQLLLLLVFPVLAVPLAMAFVARWATGYFWAYHAVLAISFAAGVCAYVAATEVAVEAAETRREQIVAALSRQSGPINLGA